MMRSMFSGVSGLRIHQSMMDVIGNNIANINTIGYKSSSVSFQNMLSQTVKGASGATENTGGSNPVQIGLGSKMSSIDCNFAQGNLQSTGKVTDMAIQGEGFFIVKSGTGTYYTRAGNFTFDSEGNLVNPADGSVVQGWMADSEGNINTNVAVTNINIPINQVIEPVATTRVSFSGNLPTTAEIGDTFTAPIEVIDSQGNFHDLVVEFEKTGQNQWSWSAVEPTGVVGDGTIEFNENGSIKTITNDNTPPISLTPAGADTINIVPEFGTIGDVDGLTQFSSDSATAAAVGQNGNVSGTLQTISIGSNGEITGVFSNGQNKSLGQLALATFKNPSGLLNVGNSFYAESNNSGMPLIGQSDSEGRGQIIVGTVEMSNVDLAKEFADMIVAQRGFQANSKIISASDEMLQELVRMKK
ncbi:MAG: flagellar hook protein FlgE [Actinomycetota bacterium]|nr:flagellar hook protein FlgE [Actinomycetota bacterium]